MRIINSRVREKAEKDEEDRKSVGSREMVARIIRRSRSEKRRRTGKDREKRKAESNQKAEISEKIIYGFQTNLI